VAITAVRYVSSVIPDDLAAAVTALLGSWQPSGDVVVAMAGSNFTYTQKMIQGSDAGGSFTIADVTGLQAALDAKADLVTGKVPIAQLPVATNAAKGIASFGSGTTVTAGAVTVP
jgi:hypothetical protein